MALRRKRINQYAVIDAIVNGARETVKDKGTKIDAIYRKGWSVVVEAGGITAEYKFMKSVKEQHVTHAIQTITGPHLSAGPSIEKDLMAMAEEPQS